MRKKLHIHTKVQSDRVRNISVCFRPVADVQDRAKDQMN